MTATTWYWSLLILTKMIHYEPVKVTVNAPGQAKGIIDVVMRQHRFLRSIVTDQSSLFTSQFWSWLYYFFLKITKKLSIAFYPQRNRQIERKNSMIEAYLRVFVNWKQDDWAKLLPMAEFAYNNAINASTGHTYLNSIMAIIPKSFSKKMLTPA